MQPISYPYQEIFYQIDANNCVSLFLCPDKTCWYVNYVKDEDGEEEERFVKTYSSYEEAGAKFELLLEEVCRTLRKEEEDGNVCCEC